MADTRTITVSLPADLVRWMDETIASGIYGSASDLVRDGLALMAEAGVSEPSDEWLAREVVPVLDACRADPSRLVSADDVKRQMDELHREAMKARGRAA